jgi:uncharacterized protein (DUF2141 family)
MALAILGYSTCGVAGDLTINVATMRNATGTIRFEVDDNAAAWNDKAKPTATASIPAAPGAASYTFKNLSPGKYAVFVYHDENNNGKLDTNLFGVPKEGFGFSNNLKLLRQPKFEEAWITVPEGDCSIAVGLKYY